MAVQQHHQMLGEVAVVLLTLKQMNCKVLALYRRMVEQVMALEEVGQVDVLQLDGK